MAGSYPSGPRTFTFEAVGVAAETVAATDAQHAVEPLYAFHAVHGDVDLVLRDTATQERLDLLLGRRTLVRHPAGEGAPDYLRVTVVRRCLTAAMLFFESGLPGLDAFGSWVPDTAELGPTAELDATPEQQGAMRADRITTDGAALAELGRLWADQGIVDAGNEFYVFFQSQGVEEDRAERVVALRLLARLGLDPVASPPGSPDGEVWVRREPRLNAEVVRWV